MGIIERPLIKIGIFCTTFGTLLCVLANTGTARIFSKNYLFRYYKVAINKFLYPNKYDDKNAQKQQAKGKHEYLFGGSKPVTFNYLDKNVKGDKKRLRAINDLIKKHYFGSKAKDKKINFEKIRSIALAPFQQIGKDNTNPDLNIVGIFVVEEKTENEYLDFQIYCTEVMRSSRLITTQNDLMVHLDNLFSRRILVIGSFFLISGCVLSYYGIKSNPPQNKGAV